ncbi:MAG TPA: hypothetical protein DGG95_08000 [Cytophagales bacterium]|nr:hypothetical protein [Cytophagales bacterium]
MFIWLVPKGNKKFPHFHVFELKCSPEEMWLECKCGIQKDVPKSREEEAYDMLRNGGRKWV